MKDKKSLQFDAASFIGGIAGLGTTLYDAAYYSKQIDDLLAEAGNRQAQINGVNYLMQNPIGNSAVDDVKRDRAGSVLKGATAGAGAGLAFGVPGAVVGGIVGGVGGYVGNVIKTESAKKEQNDANYIARNSGRVSTDYAQSLGMAIDNRKQYGIPESQVLHAGAGVNKYKNMSNKNTGLVQSKYGPMIGEVNAYTSGGQQGEQIVNTNQGIGYTVQGDSKDNKPTYLEDGDTVISKHYGLAEAAQEDVDALNYYNWAENVIKGKIQSQKTDGAKEVASKVAQPALNNIQQTQFMHNENIKGREKAQAILKKYGFLPRQPMHAENGIKFRSMRNTNNMLGLLGLTAGLGQFFQGYNERIKRPNLSAYVNNQYEDRIVPEMFGMRTNVKPILDAIDRESSYGRVRTSAIGGMGANQKMLSNMANIRNSQIAKADALFKADMQDKAYLQQADSFAGNLGAQRAQRLLAAAQIDADMEAKAHAAKNDIAWGGIRTGLDQIQNMVANNNKLGMFENMYGLYAADIAPEIKKALRTDNPTLYKQIYGTT